MTNLPVRTAGRGWSASGPGFYVWQEDPRAVRSWLAALQLREPVAQRPAVPRKVRPADPTPVVETLQPTGPVAGS